MYIILAILFGRMVFFRSYGFLFIRSSGFYLFGRPVSVVGPCLKNFDQIAIFKQGSRQKSFLTKTFIKARSTIFEKLDRAQIWLNFIIESLATKLETI